MRRSTPVLILAAVALPSAAAAQSFGPFLGATLPFDIDRGRNVGVTQRPRPGYDALGIQTGAWLLRPSLALGTTYTNNVYGTSTGKTGDAFLTVQPELLAVSQWSRHEVRLSASGNFKRFASETPRNENGYRFGATGRLDVRGDDFVSTSGVYQRSYEQQYSGSFPTNARGVVPFVFTQGSAVGVHQEGRVRFTAGGDLSRFNYQTATAINGMRISQDFRDQTIARGSARGEYALSPDAAAFVQVAYQNTDYRKGRLGGNVDRSNEEVRVLGGFTFDLTALIRASVGAGYVSRKYDVATLKSVNDVAADVRLEYFLTQLTTVNFTLRRLVQDAIDQNSSGYVATISQVRVDHELLRNLLLHAGAEYEQDSFKGITRRDKQYRVLAGADYYANRRVRLGGEVSYINRSSRGLPAGLEFNEARAALTLKYEI